MSEAWLITGIPASGKSTVARLLAGRLPHGAHIEGDRLEKWIASIAVWPEEEPEDGAERRVPLLVRSLCLLAGSFREAGFVPVLDYIVVSKARLEMYRRHLAEFDLYFVMLAPGRDVALQRDRTRAEEHGHVHVAERWAHLGEVMASELCDAGLWVDNGALTPQETVDLILSKKVKAKV